MIYPWQSFNWEYLLKAKLRNQIPHALLFTGKEGLGKTLFAQHYVSALLCQHILPGGENFCLGQVDTSIRLAKKIKDKLCHSCRLLEEEAHPNFKWIQSEKPGQALKIDQIREIDDFASHTSLQGQYRIVAIKAAHLLNRNAANALLKTLEEPGAGTILILITHQPYRLPATILSRTQRIVFTPPDKQLALQWLQEKLPAQSIAPEMLLSLSQGAPLQAIAMVDAELLPLRQEFYNLLANISATPMQFIKFAAANKERELDVLLDILSIWLTDLMKLKLNIHHERIFNHDFIDVLKKSAVSFSMQAINEMLTFVQLIKSEIRMGTNLNKQLILENLFYRWLEKAC